MYFRRKESSDNFEMNLRMNKTKSKKQKIQKKSWEL